MADLLRPPIGAVRRMFRYELTGRSAELAYYSILALFPALVVLLGTVGLLIGQEDVDSIVAAIARATSAEAAEDVRGAIEGVADRDTGAGFAVGAGLATVAYSASLYTAAFARGAGAAQGLVGMRLSWRRRIWLVPVTAAALLLLGVVISLLLLTGEIVQGVAGAVGLGGVTSEAIAIARWPLLVGVLLLVTHALFLLEPGRRSFWRPSLGAVVAVAVWLLASLGFALYTTTLASYESTYGTLTGVVSFLIWLWLSNLALLFGVALDAEIRGEPASG